MKHYVKTYQYSSSVTMLPLFKQDFKQWCSRDRNLRDRDLVKTSRRRLNEKSPGRDLRLEIRDRDFKICAFCRDFFKNVVITSMLIFFEFLSFFRTCFRCFLRDNTTNKKSLNYRNFTISFLCNIPSLETCSLRDRDDTWNLRDRASQKWG